MRQLIQRFKAWNARRKNIADYYTTRERRRMEAIMRGEISRIEAHYLRTIDDLTRQHKRMLLEKEHEMRREAKEELNAAIRERDEIIKGLKKELSAAEEQLQRAKQAYFLWREYLEEVEVIATIMQNDSRSAMETSVSIYKRFASFKDQIESLKRAQAKRDSMIISLLDIEEEDVRPLVGVISKNRE